MGSSPEIYIDHVCFDAVLRDDNFKDIFLFRETH